MAVFVCDLCNCVENTSLGHYWSKDRDSFSDTTLMGKALECAPMKWRDGTKTRWGKWHGKFLKTQWDGQREMINRLNHKAMKK